MMDEFPSNSTGPWRGIGFWDHATTSAGRRGESEIRSEDRTILREVAEKIAKLADRPREREKKELWYKHNALENERPLILADPENGWNDIIRYEDILCKGEMAKRWEVILRKELFWANEIRDDRPVEKTFYIGYTYEDTGWGINSPFAGGTGGGAYRWEPCVYTERDLRSFISPKSA